MENLTTAKNDNVISDHYKIGAYFYDAIVIFFQLFVGGANKWRKSLVTLVNPLPNEKVLELCCGTGSVSLRIAKLSECKVYASDLSMEQIKVAKFKTKFFRRDIEFSVQDASRTTYPSSYFDKVVISGALHEIKKERRQAIYHEIKRLLKDSGILITSEPDLPENGWGRECFEFMFGKWNREHDTVYELVNDGLEKELLDVGFQHEKSCTSNFDIFKSSAFNLVKDED